MFYERFTAKISQIVWKYNLMVCIEDTLSASCEVRCGKNLVIVFHCMFQNVIYTTGINMTEYN